MPNQIFYILFSLFIVYISALSILFLLSLIKIQHIRTTNLLLELSNKSFINSILILLQIIFIELEYFYNPTQGWGCLLLEQQQIVLLNNINSILYNSYLGFTISILLGIILIVPIIIFITTNKIKNKILNQDFNKSLIIWISILILEIIHLYLFILLINFSLETQNILNIFYMWICLLLTSIEASILLYLQFKD